MICGVDEAGKGSVLGPLVVAAVAVRSEDALDDLGVKDSKIISAKERERLYPLIRKRCKIATVRLDAQDIDAIRAEMTLNAAVARAHAQAINKLTPSCAYVDACDVNCFRYAEMVKGNLDRACEIVSEHHADEKFPVVSAASIIAKVTRDRAIAILSKKYGEMGSGYPSDPVTIRFLTAWIDEYRTPPPNGPEKLEDRDCNSGPEIPEKPVGLLVQRGHRTPWRRRTCKGSSKVGFAPLLGVKFLEELLQLRVLRDYQRGEG